MNPKPTIDPTKLTSEQRNQLEVYQQTQEQLRTLQDIADISQEMLSVLDAQKAGDEQNDKQMGALLMDMRDSLAALNAKEAPETPDYAKPVVDAVKGLEKALTASIKAIDVKPVIDTPQVNVSPTIVDLKGVEKAVSKLSTAFEDAIKLINIPEPPEPDFQPLLDAWSGISEQLISIENATRMKPQPGTMSISNLLDLQKSEQPVKMPSIISYENSTEILLGSNKTFPGQSINVQDFSSIMVYVYSDKSSATNGLLIQFSDNGFDWDDASPFTFTAGGTNPNDGQVFTVGVRGVYAKVTYTNTNSAQNVFRLKTILCQMPINGDIVSLGQTLNVNNHAQIVSAQLFGFTAQGNPVYIKSTPSGAIVTSSAQAEDAAHTSGDTGDFILAVRNDNLATTFTSANGDYSPIAVDDKGVQRIDPSGTTTQPVSAASLPLPTGAATSALQTTGNTSVASIDTNTAYKFAPGKLRYTNIISASTSITPTAGKAIKVISCQIVPASANASDVQMYLHFATSSIDVFKGYAGGGYGIFTGAINEVLTITQTGTGSVQVLVDYLEI